MPGRTTNHPTTQVRARLRQRAKDAELLVTPVRPGWALARPGTLQADALPDEIDVTIGSLDHPEQMAPRDQLWVSDRLPWIKLADDLPQYETRRVAGPPMSAAE